uniref:Uncharacterized protein n=1 Tax=Ascaris lumbricoides TaxID=6252 RepID=A0A9J2P726_ASCLU
MPNVVALVTSVTDGLAYVFTTEFDLEPVLDMRTWHPNERFRVGDWLYGELSKDGRKALSMERIVRRLPTSVNIQGRVQLQSVVVFAPPETSENGRNGFQPHSACWSPNVGLVGCPPNFTPPTANIAYTAWIAYVSPDDANELNVRWMLVERDLKISDIQSDVDEAVRFIRVFRNGRLIEIHCCSVSPDDANELNVRWMLVERDLQISDIQSDVDEAPWNRKAEIPESTLINIITNTYHGLVVMKKSATCMLIFSESCGLVACPCTSTLRLGLRVSFRLKPAAEELFNLTGCQYAADEVKVGVQVYSFIQHHDGMTIRCNNRIFPKIDDRTGKQSIRMDLIGDIEDTDRLVTTKMLYQENIPYEKFKETNFILPDGTEKLVNVVGLVSRVVDADGFMFVWTLGVQPDVIIKMKYCDAVKAGDWIRFSASRKRQRNRFIGEGPAVKVKTTVIDEGEKVWIDGRRIHRVFSPSLGYILDDRFFISEERYGSLQSPSEYQVLAARIKPVCECQWRVSTSDPITAEPISNMVRWLVFNRTNKFDVPHTESLSIQMSGDRKWASVESGLSEGTILTATESTGIDSNGDDCMEKTLIFGENEHIASSSNQKGETANDVAYVRGAHSEVGMPDMHTLVSLIGRMLDDERIVDALKTYRPLEYRRFIELFARI